MRRPLTFWLGLLSSCWLPALALAQSSNQTTTPSNTTTGGLAVVLLNVDGEPYNAQRKLPLGKTACDANADLHFRVTNFGTGPASAKYVEIYKGTDCNTMDAKDGVGDDDCTRITYADREQSNTIQEFHLALQELCTEEGDVTLYFLPVDTLNTNAQLSLFGMFELPLDVIPPAAPVDVRGGVGETEIPVTWTRGGQNIARNWLLWDPDPEVVTSDAGVAATDASTGGSTDEVCGSPDLMQGQEINLASLPTGIRRKEAVGDVVSAQLTGDELGSKRAALAVVSEDLAGNYSVLSNVACVNVVPTDGFWDAYKGAGGVAEEGCACSAPGSHTPARDAAGLFAGLALFAICAARLRRKRTS